MNVNGITNSTTNYSGYEQTEKVVKQETKNENVLANTDVKDGVVYEKSSESITPTTYKQDPELISRLKADSEARVQQMQDLVNKMLNDQTKTFNIATGTNLKDFFKDLVVDEATKKQAQEDISEDGYWGVKQTSQRIFDFAKALSGGDPEKMKEMQKAFEKGYSLATDAWGDELPEISKQTKEATQKLFDDYAAQFNTEE